MIHIYCLKKLTAVYEHLAAQMNLAADSHTDSDNTRNTKKDSGDHSCFPKRKR